MLSIFLFKNIDRNIITSSRPTPIQNITPIAYPRSPLAAPTLSTNEGLGTDTASESVQSSISEINSLEPFLPYKDQRRLSTGIPVTIFIPQRSDTDNPWTLSVGIYGINYQVNPNDSDYDLQKKSFLEAANIAFEWMESKKVDPEKLYITWGDRAYIQDQAERWLSQ